MSDFSKYKALETGRIASSTEIANAAQPISQSHQRELRHAVANLSAAVAESPIGTVAYAGKLTTANVTTHANAVANSTDYTVVTLSKRTGNGASVTLCTANLSNVTVTKFIPIAFTIANQANASVAAGDCVTITIAQTGNGTANNAIANVDWVIEDVA